MLSKLRTILVACAAFSTYAPALAQTATPPAQVPIVALRRLEDLADTGQGAAFARMLQTAIVSTNKFRVMDRSFASALAEQRDAQAGLVTSNTASRTGGFEGADFLIEATITTASAARRSDLGSTLVAGLLNGRGANPQCNRMTASLAVDIQILDAQTNEARYATRLNQTSQSASSCSGDEQVDVTQMLRSAADTVASGLVTTIYPIQIMAVQPDGSILLNYGEGTLVPETVMWVYGPGTTVADPGTGRAIMIDGMKIGEVRVTSVMPRFSRAIALSAETAFPVGSIVRPAPPQQEAPRRRGRR